MTVMTVLLIATCMFLAQESAQTQPPLDVQLTRVVEMRKSTTVVRRTTESFDPAGEARLVMTLELRGPLAARAYRYGFIAATCMTPEGTALSPIAAGNAHAHPIDNFIDIDREMMFAFEPNKPTDLIRMELGFEPPLRATRAVTLTGQVALLVAERQQEITFEDVRSLGTTALNHPTLTNAGLQVMLQKKTPTPTSFEDPARSIHLDITGPNESITSMKLIDDNGRVIDTMRMWQSIGSQTSYSLQGFEELPSTTHLHMTIAVGQQRIDVPFGFKNVALP